VQHDQELSKALMDNDRQTIERILVVRSNENLGAREIRIQKISLPQPSQILHIMPVYRMPASRESDHDQLNIEISLVSLSEFPKGLILFRQTMIAALKRYYVSSNKWDFSLGRL
jgi:hypothetical protein